MNQPTLSLSRRITALEKRQEYDRAQWRSTALRKPAEPLTPEPVTLSAQYGLPVHDLTQNGVDQHVTVDTSVATFAAFPANTTHVRVQAQSTSSTAKIRITFDGDTPVAATTGFLLVAGESEYWPVSLATAAQMTRDGATSLVAYAQPLKAAV